MGMHRSGLHSPQLLAICVTLGKCLPLSDSQLPNEQHETGGQKLLAMTPSWFLQKSKTLLDIVPNEEGTPANRPQPHNKTKPSLPHLLPFPRADPCRSGESRPLGPPLEGARRGGSTSLPSGEFGFFSNKQSFPPTTRPGSLAG